MITFFRKELEQFVSENNLCITMAFCGAPGAAVAIEELHAMGCEKSLSLSLRLEMRGHPIII